MELEELIKTLEGAMEKATKGEWTGEGGLIGFSRWDGSDWVHIATVADARHPDAQAIADRHNTAGDVIRRLKTERRHRDKMWAERDDWRARAEKAEAEVERLKTSPDLSWMPTDPTP